jgi:hypothetical protein
MNNTDAHILLNAAKAGHPTSRLMIMQALKVTGDLEPIKRKDNAPPDVTHTVPVFSKSYRSGVLVKSVGVKA